MKGDGIYLNIPIYGIDCDHSTTNIFIVGGGGSTKSGVSNELIWIKRDLETGSLTRHCSFSTDQEASMNISFDKQNNRVFMGVGRECWIISILPNDKFELNRKFKTDNSPPSIDGFQKTVSVWANGKILTGGVDGNLICWKGNDKFWNVDLKGEILDSDLNDNFAIATTSTQAFIYNSKGIEIKTIRPSVLSSPSSPGYSFRCIKMISLTGPDKIKKKFGKGKGNRSFHPPPSISLFNFAIIENSKDRKISNLILSNGQKYKIHDGPITTISVSRDGNWIGFGASDGSVGIWDLKNKTRHLLIRGMHQFAVCSVKITGQYLVSVSPDGWLRYVTIPPRKKSGLINYQFLVNSSPFTLGMIALISILIFVICYFKYKS